MADWDVFNGDADGICALTQLRLAEPRESQLITGVKRDIELLDRVTARPGDRLTVLDISLDKNRSALKRALEAGAEVFYVDHHFAGEIPSNPRLITLINEAPDVCTSLLVNGYLKGRFTAWAVVGAFGDNLRNAALAIARPLGMSDAELAQLEELGNCINYNGYGESVDDLHLPPEELFRRTCRHTSPLAFIVEENLCFERLSDGFATDLRKAVQTQPEGTSTDRAALVVLPDEPWARRVSGVFSNELANKHPDRAHAVLTQKADGTFVVSVRAPLNRKSGADTLCRKFPTGGGRAAAAGINALPPAQVAAFADAFVRQFSL